MSQETTQQPIDPNNKLGVEMFTFGDAEPVLDRSNIIEYIETAFNGSWYEPPISFNDLAKSFRCNPHHSSAIYFKRNRVLAHFKPSNIFSREDFARFCLDDLVFGNAFLEKRTSFSGKTIGIKTSLAKYTRAGKNGEFFFVDYSKDNPEYQFKTGSVLQIIQPDIHQEIYGLPEYLAAMQSAWLNESATLFRRRYYNNGAHAGFVFYVSDPGTDKKDIEAIRERLKSAKGPGNFKNLFYYSPNGKKDGIQIIPIADVSAKDEFFNVKNVSRDDVLAAHRIPPQLLGIIPSNSGGFGDVTKADEIFYRNEIEPLIQRYMSINTWAGAPAVDFAPYTPVSSNTKP